MIKERSGVVISSAQFPVSYSMVSRAISIANQFDFPVEDMLQNLMLEEHKLNTSKGSKINDPRACFDVCMYRIARRYRDKIRRHEVKDKNVFCNRYLTLDKDALYSKLFTSELLEYFETFEPMLLDIIRKYIECGGGSWQSIYRSYYQGRISRSCYYKNVRRIKLIAVQLKDRELR